MSKTTIADRRRAAKRDRILSTDDFTREPISIPEWGYPDGLFVTELSGEARFHLSQVAKRVVVDDHQEQEENDYILETYVVLGLVDELGEPIFSIDDAPALAKKNPEIVTRIYDRVRALSGIDAKVEAELEKKSETAKS